MIPGQGNQLTFLSDSTPERYGQLRLGLSGTWILTNNPLVWFKSQDPVAKPLSRGGPVTYFLLHIIRPPQRPLHCVGVGLVPRVTFRDDELSLIHI